MGISLNLSGSVLGPETVTQLLEQARTWGAEFTRAIGVQTKYVEFDGDLPDGHPKMIVMLEPDVELKAHELPVIMVLSIHVKNPDMTFRFADMKSGYKNGRQAVIELIYEQT